MQSPGMPGDQHSIDQVEILRMDPVEHPYYAGFDSSDQVRDRFNQGYRVTGVLRTPRLSGHTTETNKYTSFRDPVS
jgi:hypothetical protein